MNGAFKPQKAVAAIRVSTTRQGVQGDSPEAQKEQIKRFAATRNMNVIKFFEFLESGSQEKQPMQKAVDYCAARKDVELFIVKSIDRFTRGGSYTYSALKMQLEACDVRLVDIYGIIGSQKVNTLEHLGVSYKWSVYDPTKNSEILEAERASDEKRDIMSRMVGAEVRYARLGYWVRRSPLGFVNKNVETMHGKRCVLEPHATECKWILKMFELRARGTVKDQDIVDEVNKLGFKTRVVLVRSPENRTRIIGRKGGEKLRSRKKVVRSQSKRIKELRWRKDMLTIRYIHIDESSCAQAVVCRFLEALAGASRVSSTLPTTVIAAAEEAVTAIIISGPLSKLLTRQLPIS